LDCVHTEGKWRRFDATARHFGPRGKSKESVIPVLKHHIIKAYGKVKVELHALLTSELGGGGSSGSRFGRFAYEDTVSMWAWWRKEYSMILPGIESRSPIRGHSLY
jgi:hypothetical protein